MHEALGFISSTGRWEAQRKHDSRVRGVQELPALMLESALEENGDKTTERAGTLRLDLTGCFFASPGGLLSDDLPKAAGLRKTKLSQAAVWKDGIP